MAKLIFLGEKFAGRVYEFTVPKTTVGRGDHNTLAIHDASVSLSHCEIYAYGPDVIVRDLGSSNGTFVNGERLHNQQRPLAPGQSVKFGSIEARLEIESTSSQDTATDVTAIRYHAQYLREQQTDPKRSAPGPMTLDAGAESPQADHTMLLRRPAETERTPAAVPPQKAGRREKPSNLIAIAIGLGLAALALAIVGWLIWSRD